jgi:hypothetical protein
MRLTPQQTFSAKKLKQNTLGFKPVSHKRRQTNRHVSDKRMQTNGSGGPMTGRPGTASGGRPTTSRPSFGVLPRPPEGLPPD